jgi:hypothetical protein
MKRSLICLVLMLTACQGPAVTAVIPSSTPLSATAALLPSETPEPTPAETPVPSPTAVPVVRFAVIGDLGEAGPAMELVAALVDSWAVDFIITTGDNNPPIGSPQTIDANIGQYFHNYIHPYSGEYGRGAETNRFFPALGNHDWIWLEAQPYLDYFELPGNERYYNFSWEFIDFFALNSDWAEPDGIVADSVQGQWLQATLPEAGGSWQVVYFHHPPYSSGDYHGPTAHMQWPFREWGADVVFSGHDHIYERLVVDDLTYFIVGLGGGSRYLLGETYPGSQFRYRDMFGALLVEATPEKMVFRFYTVQGNLVDESVIERQNGNP